MASTRSRLYSPYMYPPLCFCTGHWGSLGSGEVNGSFCCSSRTRTRYPPRSSCLFSLGSWISFLDLFLFRALHHTGRPLTESCGLRGKLYMRIRPGIVDVRLTMVVWRYIHWSPFPACVSCLTKFITILSYRNQ